MRKNNPKNSPNNHLKYKKYDKGFKINLLPKDKNRGGEKIPATMHDDLVATGLKMENKVAKDNVNFLTASICVGYTVDGGKIQHVDAAIRVNSYEFNRLNNSIKLSDNTEIAGRLPFQLLNISDTFNYQLGGKSDSQSALHNNHILGLSVITEGEDLRAGKVNEKGPSGYQDGDYHSKFHHTEQALYEYLSNYRVVERLVDSLIFEGLPEGAKVETVILDIYSTRIVCRPCGVGALGSTHKEAPFVQNLTKALLEKGIILEIGTTPFVPRISAMKSDNVGNSIKPPKKKGDISNSMISVNRGSANDTIYQKVVKGYSYPVKLYKYTVFSSSSLGTMNKNTDKFIMSINDIVVEEFVNLMKEYIKADVDQKPSFFVNDNVQKAFESIIKNMIGNKTFNNFIEYNAARHFLQARNKIEVERALSEIDKSKCLLDAGYKLNKVNAMSLKELNRHSLLLDKFEVNLNNLDELFRRLSQLELEAKEMAL